MSVPVMNVGIVLIDTPFTFAGIVIPTRDPKFLIALAVHVPAGLLAVVTGAVAMLSRKGRGNHTRAGVWYYRSLIVVFASMTALAVMRWADDYPLFVFGLLSLVAAVRGRRFLTRRGPWRVRAHIVAMGSSYVLLLVAFYVDNGRNLPLWRDLPPSTYWAAPIAIGSLLIVRAVMRHPLAVAERRRIHSE